MNYDENPRLSFSKLKSFASSSPFVFYKTHLAPGRPTQKQTSAMTYGSAFHKLILEPEKFSDSYAVLDGRKRSKAWMDASKAFEGKIILKKSQMDELRSMEESLNRPIKNLILADGCAEECVFWEYKGTPFKSKFDFRNTKEALIVDLKTTINSGLGFAKEILKHKLHWQAYLYLKAAEASFNSPHTFIFTAIEKTYPYSVGLYTLSTQSLSIAEMEVDQALERYLDCLSKDHWPDHNNDQITEISIPIFRSKS